MMHRIARVEAMTRMDAEVTAKMAGTTKVNNTLAQLTGGMLEGIAMMMKEGTMLKQEQGRCANS